MLLNTQRLTQELVAKIVFSFQTATCVYSGQMLLLQANVNPETETFPLTEQTHAKKNSAYYRSYVRYW
jgi:hypothetical protein